MSKVTEKERERIEKLLEGREQVKEFLEQATRKELIEMLRGTVFEFITLRERVRNEVGGAYRQWAFMAQDLPSRAALERKADRSVGFFPDYHATPDYRAVMVERTKQAYGDDYCCLSH